MTNSLNFPSSEYVLVSSAFLMSIFTGYKVPYWYFNSCEILCYFLLAYMVSNKKSATFQIVSPLEVRLGNIKFLSKYFQDFFLCLLVFTIWLWCVHHGFPWVYPVCDSELLKSVGYDFRQLSEIFSHYLSTQNPCPNLLSFCNWDNMNVISFVIVLEVTHFFHFIFSLCSSDLVVILALCCFTSYFLC